MEREAIRRTLTVRYFNLCISNETGALCFVFFAKEPALQRSRTVGTTNACSGMVEKQSPTSSQIRGKGHTKFLYREKRAAADQNTSTTAACPEAEPRR
jgi:hypothetical protein